MHALMLSSLDIMLFSVNIFLFWFCWNHCIKAESIVYITDHVMTNHVIEKFGGNSLLECWVGCKTNIRCWSFNFLHDLGICEINGESHITRPEDLVRRPHSFYVANNGRKYDICNVALGMEDGKIKDHQVTQSSFLSLATQGFFGRLNNKPAAVWAAGVPQQEGEYLQIDLERLTLVTMVATQGNLVGEEESAMWVSKYKIAYSLDEEHWFDYKEQGMIKEFAGNTDPETVVLNRLTDKILTRYIRFVVVEWHHHIAMRVEVYGCLPSE